MDTIKEILERWTSKKNSSRIILSDDDKATFVRNKAYNDGLIEVFSAMNEKVEHDNLDALLGVYCINESFGSMMRGTVTCPCHPSCTMIVSLVLYVTCIRTFFNKLENNLKVGHCHQVGLQYCTREL
jgi:hypothetical protein